MSLFVAIIVCHNPFVKSGTHFFLIARRDQLENLLSIPEAARRLGGISKWTVHAWLSQGRLQRTKVGGRTMIRESELAKVIEDGGKSPSPSRLKDADQTKTEDGPAKAERSMRREGRRRNALV